ncbi:MAG TPA: metal-dependent hydrolase [Longimicrobiaceae bacterium]|nr:metal-dependent hydrolase [Longimicrobiaceae bacterium]
MDNLTHTLVGAAMGEAGLKRRTALATPTLLLGANLPDLDAAAYLWGGLAAFEWRRGWTHGVVAWGVLPLLLAGAVLGAARLAERRGWRSARAVRPRQVLLLAALSVWSHPFLDWLNTYGVRLLMPFSREWFYGDTLFIVDPWLILALGAGVALARRAEGKGKPRPGRPARAALAVAGVYVALNFAGTRAALRTVEAAVPGAGRVLAGPVMLDPTRRELLVERGGVYRLGSFGLLPGSGWALDGPEIASGAGGPAARLARATPEGSAFLRWARFPYFRAEGDTLRIADARYFGPRGSWASVAVPFPAAGAGEGAR